MDGIAAFKKEEDQLFAAILNSRWYNVWKNPEQNFGLWESSQLELFITADCNLRCGYCYLTRCGEELYPTVLRDEEVILGNIRLILQHIREEGLSLPSLELFSGEIWHTEFGLKVLQVVAEEIALGTSVRHVIIPSNCSFILDTEQTEKIQNAINIFRELGSALVFSCSVDGLIVEDIARPMKDSEIVRGQSFYDALFAFAKVNNYYFHPMVAASSIEQWRENFDWYAMMCARYDIPFPVGVMMLEVRNDDWTEEKLEHLKLFYSHVINYYINEVHDGSVKRFVGDVFGVEVDGKPIVRSGLVRGYVNISVGESYSFPSCSIAQCFTVRCGDLSIVPCHRASYDHFIGGRFVVDDGKITGTEARNVQVISKTWFANVRSGFFGCDSCKFATVCLKACIAEQYEENGELFVCNPSVCNLLRTKVLHLIDQYDKRGIWDMLNAVTPTNPYYASARRILDMVHEVIREEASINA